MNNIQKSERKSSQVTPREIEIVKELAEGKSTKEIAASLGIAVNTVEVHRHQIIKKTACKNTLHVVATLLRLGIIT